MIHLALFLLIIAAGFFDSAMDATKDLRTHFGDAGDGAGHYGHPYRSVWHACKHFMRICIAGTFLALPYALRNNVYACVITVFFGIWIGGHVWDANYMQRWEWYKLDETMRIKTGWRWLDRKLGFHHCPEKRDR